MQDIVFNPPTPAFHAGHFEPIRAAIAGLERRPCGHRVGSRPVIPYHRAGAAGRRQRQICDTLRRSSRVEEREGAHPSPQLSLCPRGGRLLGGAGWPLSRTPMCCHCLLIESDDGLILIDTGLGVEDVNEPRRLGFLFNAMARPRPRSPKRRYGKWRTWAIVPATCATSRPLISTSTMRDGLAISPARRFMFSSPSSRQPRIRRA
jgi:hypothetical protein